MQHLRTADGQLVRAPAATAARLKQVGLREVDDRDAAAAVRAGEQVVDWPGSAGDVAVLVRLRALAATLPGELLHLRVPTTGVLRPLVEASDLELAGALAHYRRLEDVD